MSLNKRFYQKLGLIVIAASGLLAACAASPQGASTAPIAEPNPAPDTPAAPEPAPSIPAGTSAETAPPIPVTQARVLAFSSSGHAELDAWRADYAARAIADGRDADIVEATLNGLKPLNLYLNPEVTTAGTGIADQAEFAKPIWDYVGSAVTDTRKTRGAEKLAALRPTFDAIEAAYGVDREALTAIWAMETNLGSYMGTFDAANTLANMAVEGRRKRFAESELTALIKLQEQGYVARGDLISGWAGAMGQTQFMPSTFLGYAVDFDGDGRKDLWNSEADALASAANYLAKSGYQKNMPWGLEVVTDRDFDWSMADGRDRRLNTWKAAGLKPMNGPFPVDDFTYANLWLPTGASGPKYLLFDNFDVFKTYNRSDSYAFSVGLLSDGMTGLNGPSAAWPTEIATLSKAEIKTLQRELNGLGYDAGPVDGIAGRGTRAALQRFQAEAGYVADGYPTYEALSQVLRHAN